MTLNVKTWMYGVWSHWYDRTAMTIDKRFTRCRLGSLPHLYHRVRVRVFRRAAYQDLHFISLSCQGPGQVECTAGFVSS
jgi:hypothetical protein